MRYIKATPKVARMVNRATIAARTPDGNYILMENDLLTLGSSKTFDTLVPALGCRLMTAQELRAEQLGGTPAELPEATDPRVAVVERSDKSDGSDKSDNSEKKGGE